MNADAIRALLHRQPFGHFQIRMTNSDTHLVRHPEMVMLAGSRLIVYYPETDRMVIVSLLHIVAVETPQAV